MVKPNKFYPKTSKQKKMRGIDVGPPSGGFYDKLTLMTGSGLRSAGATEAAEPLKALIFVKDPEAYAKEAKKEGIKVIFVHKLIGAVTIEAPPQSILEISDQDVVVKIWEDLKVHSL